MKTKKKYFLIHTPVLGDNLSEKILYLDIVNIVVISSMLLNRKLIVLISEMHKNVQ